MPDALTYIEQHLDRFRSELYDFLRIPSVSAKAEHDDDTRGAAVWLADRLADAGLQAEVVDTAGHPIVLGEWRGAGPDVPLDPGHPDPGASGDPVACATLLTLLRALRSSAPGLPAVRT